MTNLKVKRKPYFYDSQVKRYLAQIMTCFAGYQVRTGKLRNGEHRFIDVPVIYGGYSRVSEWTIKGGGINGVPALPIISVETTKLEQDNNLRRAPTHTETKWWDERTISGEGMGDEKGDRKMGTRYMPVPYNMGIQVSIWTSNQDQAYQISEQIATVFNPDIDIQISNSPLDWTFRTVMTFQGDIDIQGGGFDLGQGEGVERYHVFTMDFSLPIYLSPPMKVQTAKIIESVHLNIKELNEVVDWDTMSSLDDLVITGS